MKTEGTNKEKKETNSADHGCGPMGKGMFEMMSACCEAQGGHPGCSAMMKGMMEKMGHQSCCAPGASPEPDRRGK